VGVARSANLVGKAGRTLAQTPSRDPDRIARPGNPVCCAQLCVTRVACCVALSHRAKPIEPGSPGSTAGELNMSG
jgi:hypothetical protein